MPFFKSLKLAGGHFQYIRLALRLRIPLAVMTMVFAVLGLAANFANVDLLLRPLDGRAATHPITAICLFFIGLGAFRLKRFGRTPIWWYLAAAGIVSVCATRLMETMLTTSTGAPGLKLFGPFAGFSGQFSIESAIALGAFALAAVLRQSLGRFGMGFLVIGLATIFNTLLELSYGLTFFNGNVGAFSLLGLGCAALATITVYIHRPFIRVSFLMGDIGSQTRVMAVAAVAIPWTCGFLLHTFKDIGGNSVPFEAAMISVITWSMLVILLTTSARHEGADVARRRAEREIAMLSRIDPLTKALNRFGMTEVVDGAWVEFKSSGSMFGMLMLDVDYFRRINDTFGRDAGDDVLERVAATIQPQLRDNDALGRWGSEEFLILLKIKAVGDLEIVAERLRDALRDVNSPFCAALDGEPMRITASFGISDMREDDEGPTESIKRADMQLYLAKTAARTNVASQYDLLESEDQLLFRQDMDEDIKDTSDKDDGPSVIAA